jgi:Spy/CpxP family protein refolding chaperone
MILEVIHMKRLIPVLVILLAASITFAQMQQGREGKMGGKGMMGGKCAMMQGKMGGSGCGCMGMMGDHMFKKLGLSDQEKAGIKEITDKLKSDMDGIHEQMMNAHKALHEEYMKKDLDNGAIDGLNRKILGLHSSKMELMLNARKAIMNRLTAEQREKLVPPAGKCPMKGDRPGKGRGRNRK